MVNMRLIVPIFSTFLMTLPCFASQETNSAVLDKIWAVGQKESCTAPMRSQFSSATLADLKSRLTSEMDRGVLETIVNPFLFSLGISHTEFFTENDETYYAFKGFLAETDPSLPPPPMIVNPGIQVGVDEHGFFAREVLNGSPARLAEIKKGDRLLSIEGKPFGGGFGHQAQADTTLVLEHHGSKKIVHLPLPSLNWSQAFEDATLKSIQVLSNNNRRVGYVRLWSGLHPDSQAALWSAVKQFEDAHVDGVILDLRGGYGGKMWENLDPFFKDRSNYFVLNLTDKNGNLTEVRPDPQVNPDAYLGPLVVLINEGSRSAREALAFQFRKSKRATVVGASTPGYFSGGGIFLADQPSDYLLYLCINQGKLDGEQIEGVGVKPDVSVEYSDDNELQDSQLKAGLEILTEHRPDLEKIK